MKGKLKLAANKKTWLLVREDGKEMQVPAKALTRSLFPLNPQTHDGLEVEYELDKGLPAKIYEVGAAWQPQGSAAPMHGHSRSPRQGSGKSYGSKPSYSQRDPGPQRQYMERQPVASALPGDFHNPYNFVPAPPRNLSPAELGDHSPIEVKPQTSYAGHDRYVPDRWSGRIAVTMKTLSPLLLIDAATAEKDEEEPKHKIYGIRCVGEGEEKRPYVPPTSIKGMLRAAYEIVTNSRLAAFPQIHEDRLAWRMKTDEGLALIPAQVKVAGEVASVELFTGTSEADSTAYAAWLPRYDQRNTAATRNATLRHQQEVEAWVERFQHWRWDKYKNGGSHVQDFQYWRVVKVVSRGQSLGNAPMPTRDPGRNPGRSYHQPLNEPLQQISGIVCISNKNIDRKHDERVFFNESGKTACIIGLSKDETKLHKKAWRELIDNYRIIHEDEIKDGKKSPPALNHSVWSRHIDRAKDEREWKDGMSFLCYAAVASNGTGWEVKGLYPVMISRALHQASPLSLLDGGLKPASKKSELSPADRVFGWVNQDGAGAWRGCLRVLPVTCQDTDSIEEFGDKGFPLAILGAPKPQQARFYVAASPGGKAQQNHVEATEARYSADKGLRGRKVYPHHNDLPDSYWNAPTEDRTQLQTNGFFQEYRRPREAETEDDRGRKRARLNSSRTAFLQKEKEQRDNQNRSIRSWIKSGKIFCFELEVTNLSSLEIGALLWLLSLPPGHFHRFGGGKPLGFGSVRLEIDWGQTQLHKGTAWASYYQSLDAEFAHKEGAQQRDDFSENCVKPFQQAVAAAYKETEFSRVSFIAAFLQGARGFSDRLPIHYPRARVKGFASSTPVPPHPEGKAYEWFVANERVNRKNPGPKLSLPDLANDQGLPVLDES